MLGVVRESILENNMDARIRASHGSSMTKQDKHLQAEQNQ
jgi:hypothetical protein